MPWIIRVFCVSYEHLTCSLFFHEDGTRSLLIIDVTLGGFSRLEEGATSIFGILNNLSSMAGVDDVGLLFLCSSIMVSKVLALFT